MPSTSQGLLCLLAVEMPASLYNNLLAFVKAVHRLILVCGSCDAKIRAAQRQYMNCCGSFAVCACAGLQQAFVSFSFLARLITKGSLPVAI